VSLWPLNPKSPNWLCSVEFNFTAKNQKIVHKNAQSRTTTHEKYEANPKNGGIARPSNITPK
jgi:hypothetical protein